MRNDFSTARIIGGPGGREVVRGGGELHDRHSVHNGQLASSESRQTTNSRKPNEGRDLLRKEKKVTLTFRRGNRQMKSGEARTCDNQTSYCGCKKTHSDF